MSSPGIGPMGPEEPETPEAELDNAQENAGPPENIGPSGPHMVSATSGEIGPSGPHKG